MPFKLSLRATNNREEEERHCIVLCLPSKLSVTGLLYYSTKIQEPKNGSEMAVDQDIGRGLGVAQVMGVHYK